MFVIGLGGILYTAFRAFYDPQKKSETNDLLMDQKANFLSEIYERRFKEIQTRFNELASQNQNHLHTLDTKMDEIRECTSVISRDVVRLQTIIDERIPKKP